MFGRVFDYLRDKITAPPPPPEERGALLPFDLLLTTGNGSLLLFPRGPIDEFSFFQRRGVSDHKVEFLSRLDPDADREDYRPYGLFRFRPAEALTLVRSRQVQKLYDTLTKGCGLRRMPEAAAMSAKGFTTHDPSHGQDASKGRNRLCPNPHARTPGRGGKRLTYAEVLETMRAVIAPREKIAWIEDAFDDVLPEGEIVHRYYLGSNQEAFLVRHHWEEGKRLFKAETTPEAIEVCMASGHFRRLGRRAA